MPSPAIMPETYFLIVFRRGATGGMRPVADLPAGAPFAGQFEDLVPLPGVPVRSAVGARAAAVAQPLRGASRRDRAGPGGADGHGPYVARKLFAYVARQSFTADRLRRVSADPGHERAEEGLVVRERGRRQAPDRPVQGPHPPARPDPLPSGSRHVEHRAAGPGGRNPYRCTGRRSGLPDHLGIRFDAERLVHSAAHRLVVAERE
ncbi:hypothetical protein FB157_105257 [Streptomyces sp. BK340]|nr:hypothetical protein FB157_105257 [Streptomyces sp. BK340]